jgi:hypothetical protein
MYGPSLHGGKDSLTQNTGLQAKVLNRGYFNANVNSELPAEIDTYCFPPTE